MMALVLILIAEILSGFTLRELDSWLVVMEPMRFPMTVCHALRVVAWILSFALVVLGKYYLSDTKTGKERSLPITSELENFLNEMRKLQAQYGITDDFVISTGTGKLRTNSLSNYMLRLSHKLNFSVTKNIHTIRRTFNHN